ncbi:hypothetical protein LINPERPRIM_LOCUS30678 [Linum perenne]
MLFSLPTLVRILSIFMCSWLTS